MMLYRQGGQAVFLCEQNSGARAVVIRMQVVRNDVGLDIEQIAHALYRFIEKGTGDGIVKVANVR